MPPNTGTLDFSFLPKLEQECEQELIASEITTTTTPSSGEAAADSDSYWNWPSTSTTATDTSSTERTAASDLSRSSHGLQPPPPPPTHNQQPHQPGQSPNPDHDDYWAENTTTTCNNDQRREDVNVKYLIDYSRLIGRGRQTIVRQCIEQSTGQQFAIKSVNKIIYTQQAREMKHEAAMLRRITMDSSNSSSSDVDGDESDENCRRCPNSIIKLHDVLEDDYYFYMVTELCQGGELYDRVIEKATLPSDKNNNNNKQIGHYAERDAARIVRQVVQAVAFLHSKNIVHRDIKLENVLLSKQDRDCLDIRLIDFGLSVQHDPDSDAPPLTDLVGTVYYMAPEVLNRCYTKTCDIWSLGVLTFALLSATSPFCGETDEETYEMILQSSSSCNNHDIVEFPSPDWDDITDTAKDFIRALLQRDAQRRPTAAELLQHEWLQPPQQELQKRMHIHKTPTPLASRQSQPKSSSQKSRMLQRFKQALQITPTKRNKSHS